MQLHFTRSSIFQTIRNIVQGQAFACKLQKRNTVMQEKFVTPKYDETCICNYTLIHAMYKYWYFDLYKMVYF